MSNKLLYFRIHRQSVLFEFFQRQHFNVPEDLLAITLILNRDVRYTIEYKKLIHKLKKIIFYLIFLKLYHMCDGLGRQFSYSCPNTTLFQQRMLICDHWYMVNCSKAESNYNANLLIGKRLNKYTFMNC